MFAKQRLFLTSDKARLVLEDDPAAASLYAIPGDEIPDSAAGLFGLVEGELREAILRVVVIGSDPVAVAGLRFGGAQVLIHDDQIDEEQLLSILADDRLEVEARMMDDSWTAFPSREKTVAALRFHVDQDKAHGRPHDRVTLRKAGSEPAIGPELPDLPAEDAIPVDDTMVPVPPPVDPVPAAPIVPTDSVAAPVAAVVGAEAVAAAIEGNAPLPEPSPIAAPIDPDAAAASVTADDAAVAAIRGDAPLSDAEPAPAPAPAETPKEKRPGEDKERRPRETKARTPRADAE